MSPRLFPAALLLWGAATTPATAYVVATGTVMDDYWGATDHGYGDVLASPAEPFQVDRVEVQFSSEKLVTLTVYTHFQEGIPAALGMKYGDLFLSSDGWHPTGSPANHYRTDDLTNGEHWEFVFDTSEGALYGGNFSILSSSDWMQANGYGNWLYRDRQEVLRGTGGTRLGQSGVAFGSADGFKTVTYTLDMAWLGIRFGQVDPLAFKWGMTCANDTIEGAVAVPTLFTPSGDGAVPAPATGVLLAGGLLGLGVWRRRRA